MGAEIKSEEFFSFAQKIAREAGAHQRKHIKSNLKVEFKGDINLVTEVDRHCEEIIVSQIAEKYPDHDIMAEEGTGDRKDSAYKWIIDPLDGTTNFAHSYPLFAVSIALEHNGQVVGGVVYDPMRDEMFRSFKGAGAFLNDEKISVSDVKTIDRAMVATGFAYNLRQTDDNNLNHFENVLMKAQAVRRDGVAAIDLCYVACGRYDAFWELNLFPWDTAAGMLIALEAGATVSKFDGSSYTVYEKDIVISNSLIHQELVDILKSDLKKTSFSS